jgi:hypothetical protein
MLRDADAAAAFAPLPPLASAALLADEELDAPDDAPAAEHAGARAAESEQPPDAQQAGMDDAMLSDDAMALQRSPASADAIAEVPPPSDDHTRAELEAALASSRAECAQLAAQLAEQRVRADAAQAAAEEAARLRAEDAAVLQARAAELQRASRRSASLNARNAAARAAGSQRVIGFKQELAVTAEAARAAAATAAETAERQLADATLCIVCCSAPRDTKHYECGHLFCGDCGLRMLHCPHGCDVIEYRDKPSKSLRTKLRNKLTVPQQMY